MVGDESSTGSGGGFRSHLHYFLYSRKKKHVFAGIAIISVVFVVSLYFMTIGILSILDLQDLSTKEFRSFYWI
ncbi:hypothetical protein KSP40_PGU015902 [Platanthera guangdongensis]|uniref:Uncharacterized protein n=1 Tax=Platanthera guangdongensis TaxID=2320717 RepID=A0ABR2MA48_9ASPA